MLVLALPYLPCFLASFPRRLSFFTQMLCTWRYVGLDFIFNVTSENGEKVEESLNHEAYIRDDAEVNREIEEGGHRSGSARGLVYERCAPRP
eukprot:633057-Amorphochlora_amoeboformis.AAC.1